MNTDGNYPPGAANDPNAPWNEKETPEKEFEVCITQTLSKSVKVTTNDYIPDEGVDDDGHYYFDTDTSDTDWDEVYSESNHYTPLQLIEKFKKYLEIELAIAGNTKDKKKLEHLIEECDNWCMDDIEIFEDK
jgi:hypothetical protein